MPKKFNQYFDDVIIIKHKHPFIRKVLTFILCAICILFVIFVADVITSYVRYGKFSFASLFKTKRSNVTTYYLVTLGSFDNIDDAKQRVSTTHLAGAGSYIWQKDNLYLVIANVYSSREDATSVSSGLSEYNSNVVEVKIDKSKVDDATLQGTFDIFEQVYAGLYNTSLGMDKKEITYLIASNLVTSLNSKVKVWQLELGGKTTSSKDMQDGALINLQSILEDLSLKILNNDQPSYLIKYAIIDTVHIYSDLVNSL